jgi:hypothetical protein
LLDHRPVAAESVDARQRGAQPFLGDTGLQPGLWRPCRLAFEPYFARTPTAFTDTSVKRDYRWLCIASQLALIPKSL